jgi:hypothetical protein
VGRAISARSVIAAAVICAAAFATPLLAQTNPQASTETYVPPAPTSAAAPRPDPVTQAYLFGAAYKQSDLSPDRAGGMMFLPGRGLIRWETRGKTLEEQEELKVEAIGRADARAVQQEIDAQQAVRDRVREQTELAVADHEHRGFAADARAVPALNMPSVTGTRRQAGAVLALNRAAIKDQFVHAMGVKNGTSFKERNRLYVFGAVSGRAVGLNLLHDNGGGLGGGWRNAGLSTDRGGFVGQRQAGLALRNGRSQIALSYVREKTHAQLLGITSIKDHRAMLNFTFTPGGRK